MASPHPSRKEGWEAVEHPGGEKCSKKLLRRGDCPRPSMPSYRLRKKGVYTNMDNKLLAILLIGGIILIGLLFALMRLGGQEVKIALSEWKLEPASIELPPGKITFIVTNAGTMEHEFEIEAHEREFGYLEHIAPGQTKRLTVALDAGEYELYCPIPGHKEKGLVGTLVITPGAVQTPSQKL